MKKLLVTALAASTIMFIGCGGNQPQKPNFEECNIDGGPTPAWACNPNIEGGIAALGIGEPNAANDYSMQLEEATADGRDKLARRISVKVKNMFKKFKATTGYGKDATFDRATESVSKQIAYQTLNGSKVIKVWKSPRTGKLYVLVALPNAAEKIKEATKTSLKNNKALWQKFLAERADKKLDEEIDKEFGGNEANQ